MIHYTHKAQYYETDQMGVIHHSNYIRWLEEARVAYMEQMGMGYDQMEKEGIISPVIEVKCRYKKSIYFPDIVCITAHLVQYTGTRMTLSYRIFNSDEELCAEAETHHCFINRDGHLVTLKKAHPTFHALFENVFSQEQNDPA